MKIINLLPFLFVVLMACSSGQKAFHRGNYFEAVNTAVERLRSNPDHKKSAQVLQSSYPQALQWAQGEIDLLLSGNDPLKWEKTVNIMRRVNNLASEIRRSPAALRIVPVPKVYTSEMNMALERAAEETYQGGLALMQLSERQAAREAYSLFMRSNELVPGYKDTPQLIREAKARATLNVIVEPIPVHSRLFELSAGFFYNQVYEYLNRRFPQQGFVNFFNPEEFEKSEVNNPDMILHLEFFDFVVGALKQSESEREVTNTVKKNPKDTLSNETITYKAKLKTFSDQVASGGVVDMKIQEWPSGKLLVNDRIPGEFIWINRYAIFVGDEKALSAEQLQLTKQKMVQPPPPQMLFVEFTKPIYDQLTGRLNNFFGRYR
jgi:hypothetical protein